MISAKRDGGPALGFWLERPNLAACEIAAIVGYDIVVFDMEHGAISFSDAERLIPHAKLKGLTVYSRVAAAERAPIQQALDSGADGVIIPQIKDLAHAREVTAYAKYPMLGTRGIGYTRSRNYGSIDDAFLVAENKRMICLPMIETPGALQDAEAIAALDTVDGLFIGIGDLSATRGRGIYQATNDDIQDALDVVRATSNAGKTWSAPAGAGATYRFARDNGADFVTIDDDLRALRAGLEQTLRNIAPDD